jgi:SET domain-containing protein
MTTSLRDGMLTPEVLALLIDNAPKCIAATSAIHGYGLFAREVIRQFEVIVDFSDADIFLEISQESLEDWRLLGGKFTPLSADTCLISKYLTKYALLNHSRNPNAKTDFTRRVVCASADIEVGEEVTVDYRLEIMPSRVSKAFGRWM